jgi:hypothetical protein
MDIEALREDLAGGPATKKHQKRKRPSLVRQRKRKGQIKRQKTHAKGYDHVRGNADITRGYSTVLTRRYLLNRNAQAAMKSRRPSDTPRLQKQPSSKAIERRLEIEKAIGTTRETKQLTEISTICWHTVGNETEWAEP